MALVFHSNRYEASCRQYNLVREPELDQHDAKTIHADNYTNWCSLQWKFDLQQYCILVLECFLCSNAQGT